MTQKIKEMLALADKSVIIWFENSSNIIKDDEKQVQEAHKLWAGWTESKPIWAHRSETGKKNYKD